MRRLFIIGCSGHGKVAADIAVRMKKYDQICFLDDNPREVTCMGFPVIGKSDYADITDEDEVFVAIGNPQIREKLLKQCNNRELRIATLLHPNAVIAMHVTIGKGSIIMAGTVINSDTVLGDGVILNTGSTVDHDNQISDYSHISVGAHLAGTVGIGKRTWIGAGAIVSNNISIYHDVMIGAGAVVINNIEEPGTYVGVPAKRIR